MECPKHDYQKELEDCSRLLDLEEALGGPQIGLYLERVGGVLAGPLIHEYDTQISKLEEEAHGFDRGMDLDKLTEYIGIAGAACGVGLALLVSAAIAAPPAGAVCCLLSSVVGVPVITDLYPGYLRAQVAERQGKVAFIEKRKEEIAEAVARCDYARLLQAYDDLGLEANLEWAFREACK